MPSRTTIGLPGAKFQPLSATHVPGPPSCGAKLNVGTPGCAVVGLAGTRVGCATTGDGAAVGCPTTGDGAATAVAGTALDATGPGLGIGAATQPLAASANMVMAPKRRNKERYIFSLVITSA